MAEVKTNRPPADAFRQQKLKAWQPILTPFKVIIIFIAVGVSFIPTGIFLLGASNAVFKCLFPSLILLISQLVLAFLADWMCNTFQLPEYNYDKRNKLADLFSRIIIVPKRPHSRKVQTSNSANQALRKSSVKNIPSDMPLQKPSSRQDHCNLMMFTNMVLPISASSGEEIVVVFEETSKTESNAKNEVWLGHFAQDDQTPYHQYFKFCSAVSTITEEELEANTRRCLASPG
mmetsp:Transcript_22884/g.32889  ORF Transcript_22884/g.32889 Transcript_22884/m.32889 type:complete len:232 (+) Transcript_22884:181-876(+)